MENANFAHTIRDRRITHLNRTQVCTAQELCNIAMSEYRTHLRGITYTTGNYSSTVPPVAMYSSEGMVYKPPGSHNYTPSAAKFIHNKEDNEEKNLVSTVVEAVTQELSKRRNKRGRGGASWTETNGYGC